MHVSVHGYTLTYSNAYGAGGYDMAVPIAPVPVGGSGCASAGVKGENPGGGREGKGRI